MNSCNCLSGCELVTLASTLSCIIAQNLSPDDIGTLGNFFLLLAPIYLLLPICNLHVPIRPLKK